MIIAIRAAFTLLLNRELREEGSRDTTILNSKSIKNNTDNYNQPGMKDDNNSSNDCKLLQQDDFKPVYFISIQVLS